MKLFPAIDLRGGQVVRLTQGDYDRMTVYGADPAAQAEDYLALGVGRCILGSAAVTDFGFTARMLRKYGPRLAVGVDLKDGRAAIHGWRETSGEDGLAFCRRLADAGCTAVIVTDIARDGAMQGTNLELYRRIRQELPGLALTASGGISRMEELDALDEMGAAAAILGKSLYAGRGAGRGRPGGNGPDVQRRRRRRAGLLRHHRQL